jgi:hypothetical protein
MNPCGGAVDWIRAPFEVWARIHDALDAPVVRLRWMFTAAPSVVPPDGIAVNNRVLDFDQESDLVVGQFPLAISDYKQDYRWKLPAGLPNGHVCEQRWFSTGEPYPNSLPPSRWSASGYPDCCGVIIEPAKGGLAFGAARLDQVSGGFALGGAAGDLFAPPLEVSGGFALGSVH